jgi:hypothetical protein
MNSDAIRELLNRRPFEPFEVQMSGGEVYEVRHPKVVALGRTRMAIMDPDTDRMAVCALLHVTSIRTLQAS